MATAGAGCDTANFTRAPASTGNVRILGPAPVAIGDILPRGEYSVLLNRRYYGLPPSGDGWVYMRIKDDVYRVDYATRRVLERVTMQTSANFP